jgi:tRNA (mo5U34)-methyltransferase
VFQFCILCRHQVRSSISTPDADSAQTANPVYFSLSQATKKDAWLQALCALGEREFADHVHGDLPRWRRALESLPTVPVLAGLEGSTPVLGHPVSVPVGAEKKDFGEDETIAGVAALREALMELHPWRKGPLQLGGLYIDTEWRSDWKWDRLSQSITMRGCRVLDIGCGNGYYGWRMLGAGAALVVGIDPTLVYVMQWLACRHFAGDHPNYVLPLRLDQLPAGEASFDRVFSMGVLYHRRDHLAHLRRVRELLAPGGIAVIETLVLPRKRAHDILIPAGRYARMRNVWAVPGTAIVEQWMIDAGLESPQLIDYSRTTVREQRTTAWMRFESLDKALDPSNPDLTIEDHPAPRRAIWLVRRPD